MSRIATNEEVVGILMVLAAFLTIAVLVWVFAPWWAALALTATVVGWVGTRLATY